MKKLDDFFNIIFQNDDFLVINKDNNISTQENEFYEDSIEKTLKTYGEPFVSLTRHGIVHRLDKNTTGLLLIAKSEHYFSFLTNLFKERKIEKIYLSLHKGKPESDKGEISFFLKKKFSKNKKIKMKLSDSEGKLVKLSFQLVSQNNEFSLVKVIPLTGRTHQIRLAFETINFPIYGDKLYNKEVLKENSFGQYLHAHSLSFFDNNRKFEFFSDLPNEFREIIKLK